jgi:hypothetical protein
MGDSLYVSVFFIRKEMGKPLKHKDYCSEEKNEIVKLHLNVDIWFTACLTDMTFLGNQFCVYG